MDKQRIEKQQVPEQLSDILLVLDRAKKKIQAVKDLDKNGKLKAVNPDRKHQEQFMKVDRGGDLFSNFFSNFIRQLKNPTNFSFFRVPASVAIEAAEKMQQHLKSPTPEGEKLMRQHEVKADAVKNNKQENKNDMETTHTPPETGEFRYRPEQIDWETMNNLGLSKEKLEKWKVLEPLLKGYKTNELYPVSVNLESAIIRMDARISLQPNGEGKVVAAIHGIRKAPNLDFAFFGHEFSKEDKENLLKTRNMGRVVDLIHPKTNEVMPSIISVDKLTNELIALQTKYMKIPDEIKGVALSEEQKQTLMEGKPVYLEGMLSKKGEPFDTLVQFNADKRFVEFMFDRTGPNAHSQESGQNQSGELSRSFRGKELDDNQYQQLKEGQTVYLSGLKDKKGSEYQGYITLNKETNKVEFAFKNPNQLKDQIKPTEPHKTQTAVNSEGKTNEATKKIKEPLKSGQQDPDSQKQQAQQEKPEKPAKSKGRKL
ncbi:DUF3945 domain-containing protein [Pedobacter sp. ASV28]|uniref:DUF3945 domain-containing protein n=1 Tax=Pedobacter sp. ASV28 TaxID=2795123 RepID=UPI0018ED67BB|nr:DUF3945 domain-containing protein [Pedobacter sp. ASV28]